MKTPPALFATLLALASIAMACGSDADDAPASAEAEQSEPSPSAAQTDDTASEVAPADVALEGAIAAFTDVVVLQSFFLEQDPTADVGVVDRMLDTIGTALATLAPEISESEAALVEVVDEWRSSVETGRAEMDARRDEFQAAFDAWDRADDSPPPAPDFFAVIDANFRLGEVFVEACRSVAVDRGIAPNCDAVTGPPSEAAGGPPASEAVDEVAARFGDLMLVLSPGPLLEPPLVVDGLIGLDLDPRASLTILEAPDVANPDTSLSAELVDAAPWPDDVEAWAAAAGIDVTPSETVVLGPREFDRVDLAGAGDESAVISNDAHPEGAYVLRSGDVFRIWETDIDGTVIVAVLDHRGGPIPDRLADAAESILASMLVV